MHEADSGCKTPTKKYEIVYMNGVKSVIIAQRENECISLSVLPVVQVQLPAMSEYFKDFSLADHTHLERRWRSPSRHKPIGSSKDSDSDIIWCRKMVAVLPSILICHFLDTKKDTYIHMSQ